MFHCLTDFDFPSAPRTLFTIMPDPEQAANPGALIEGEHKLRSQALMFEGRGSR